ncbi:hypothetical protein HOY82DRAFT_604804 [Tuber indicum]|nr:hypothetical protein HOY82DRAFT_604804 [Tuber indicum]
MSQRTREPTDYVAELILNNFLTPLGKRDYNFFRRYRNIFRDRLEMEKPVGYRIEEEGKNGGIRSKGNETILIRVGLQELGPQFTLKLMRVEWRITEGAEWEWKGKKEMGSKRFQL